MQGKSYNSEYGKLDYSFLVLDYTQALGKQLLKLPHEIVEKDVNTPLGCTYADIIQSYCDGVRHLEGLLCPYLTKEYLDEITALGEEKTKGREHEFRFRDFQYNQKKFAALMRLCDAKGFLLGKVAGKTPLEGEEDG